MDKVLSRVKRVLVYNITHLYGNPQIIGNR